MGDVDDYLDVQVLPTWSLEAVRRIATIFSRSSLSRSSELEMRGWLEWEDGPVYS